MEALITYSDFADRVSSYSDESIVWTLKDIAEALQCAVANLLASTGRLDCVIKYTEQLKVVEAERSKRVAAYRREAWQVLDGSAPWVERNARAKVLEAKATMLEGNVTVYN